MSDDLADALEASVLRVKLERKERRIDELEAKINDLENLVAQQQAYPQRWIMPNGLETTDPKTETPPDESEGGSPA